MASVASRDERHEKEVVVAIAKIYGPLGRDQSKSLLPQVLVGAAAASLTALAAAGAHVVLKGGGERNQNAAGYPSQARPSQLDSAERAPVQEVHGGDGGGAGEGGGNGDNDDDEDNEEEDLGTSERIVVSRKRNRKRNPSPNPPGGKSAKKKQ